MTAEQAMVVFIVVLSEFSVWRLRNLSFDLLTSTTLCLEACSMLGLGRKGSSLMMKLASYLEVGPFIRNWPVAQKTAWILVSLACFDPLD